MSEQYSGTGVRRSIAITGISGYIGSRLLQRLSRTPEILHIAGIDIRPPSLDSNKLKFYLADVRKPLEVILCENRVDTVIHLAFILKPTHRKSLAGQVDIGGTINLLESCRKAGVKYLLYLSSHTVYGAFPDNPPYIQEDWKIRPLPGFQYSEDKVEVERLLLEFCRGYPETRLTILRACPVIGPGAADSVSTVMMKQPLMIRIRGYDPPLQFIHEDDLVELMTGLIIKPVPGIYNVSGDGEIKYSEISRLSGKKMVVLPEKLLRFLIGISWKLRLQNQSPSIGLEFIKYPPLISTAALKNKINFRFRYSSGEAVKAYLEKLGD